MLKIIHNIVCNRLIVTAAIAIVSLLPSSALATTRVTEGPVYLYGNQYIINAPATRFEFVEASGERLTIRTLYQGPTTQKSYLASGSYVSQVALKLRNKNTCNLVYASRRIYPSPAIVISLKSNPGLTTHSQCGARGYHFIGSVAMPWIPAGTVFDLGGSFVGNILTVTYNGRAVWRGYVPFSAGGNVGVRTDNAKATIVRIG